MQSIRLAFLQVAQLLPPVPTNMFFFLKLVWE